MLRAMTMVRLRRLALGSTLVVVSLACAADDDDDSATGADTHDEHHEDTGDSSAGDDDDDDDDGSTTSADDDGSSTEGGTSTGADESTGVGDSSSTGAAVTDTWENWALPDYFQPYCIGCHPGDSPRDFTDYDVVVENVEHIRCGSAPKVIRGCDGHIEPGHLPIGEGPFPTDDERYRLVDWIDAGMPRDP
jgi:hypothetical protein